MTFSGHDFNYAEHGTQQGAAGKPPTVTDGAVRIVNGWIYVNIGTAVTPLWLGQPASIDHDAAHFPEPQTMLQLLSPRAKFQSVGWQVIRGIRLEHLRAPTSKSHRRRACAAR